MTYNLKWLPADIIFVSDLLANTMIGSQYYAIFTSIGIPGNVVNVMVSVLQLVRVAALYWQYVQQR